MNQNQQHQAYNQAYYGQNEQGGGLQAMDYWQVVRNRYGVILLSLLLVFLTAAAITYIMPARWEASALVEVKNVGLSTSPLGYGGTATPGERSMASTQFIQTQFEVMTSAKALEKVVRELNLVDRWGMPDEFSAVRRLQGMVRTRPIRGTDLIEIRVSDSERLRPAEIANEVYRAYRQVREEEINQQNQQVLGLLDKQLNEQEERVRQARVRMQKHMQEQRIVDLGRFLRGGGRGDEVDTGEAAILDRSRTSVFQLEQEIETLRAQIAALQNLEGDDLIRKAGMLGLDDPTIKRFYPQFNELILQENQAEEQGLGQRHPARLAIRSQLDSIKGILTGAVTDLRGSLDIQLAQAEAKLNVAREQTEGREETFIDDNMKYVTYQQARDEFYMQRDIEKTLIIESLKQKIEHTMPRRPIVVWQEAHPSNSPAAPNKPLVLIIGGVLGLVFGLGLAFLLEFMDTSVKSIEDVERYLGVPVLAVIPKHVGLLHRESGLSPDAEAYRILRTNIEFNRKSADANSITMVSGGAGEGKSTTMLNLAYICAQGGYNTLMIDADLRRPTLHTYFDINNSVGLTNYLTTELALEDVILQTPVDNLYFMPSGILPSDAAGILNSRRMSELIADVKSRFDLVLLDSPPILGVSDASVLASEVDLTVVIVQHRKLPRNMLMRVRQAVENVGGNLLGVVLNNVDLRSDNQYQYYTSYYTYYAPANRNEARQSVADAKAQNPASSVAKSAARKDVEVREDAF